MQSESEKGTTETHRIQRRDTLEREQARESEKCDCEAEVFPFITGFISVNRTGNRKMFWRFISKVTIKSD